MRVRYNGTFAVITDVDDNYEPGDTVEVLEAGQVDGMQRAKIVD